ncbi:MAG: hypothetical protein EOP83_31645 [Verrucomicrobiaceae bacterium]|nr:MAG: hypothetical protein EOP83_31645 [Verrucomicrobiaceae bacterium]
MYLINEMQETIEKIFDKKKAAEIIIIGADGAPTDKWKRLADEAEQFCISGFAEGVDFMEHKDSR